MPAPVGYVTVYDTTIDDTIAYRCDNFNDVLDIVGRLNGDDRYLEIHTVSSIPADLPVYKRSDLFS